MAICHVPLILPRVKARGRLVAAYVVGNGFKPFSTKDFEISHKRDFANSTCICLLRVAPPYGAEAGPFLSNLLMIHTVKLLTSDIRLKMGLDKNEDLAAARGMDALFFHE